MLTILRKELSDHFSSTRFIILFCLILMVSLVTTYMAGTGLREELEGVVKPKHVFLMVFNSSGQFLSLAQFVAFFGPLIGILLGFDAVNRERNQRTLSKLVSQPIFRDAVINGKFLAGVITITVIVTSLLLLVSGLGLFTIGVVPGPDEVGRLAIYLLVSIAYASFWLGLAILFSIVFKSLATSALASVALWIFFSFFIGFASTLYADLVAPVDNPRDPAEMLRNGRAEEQATLVSPVVLYSTATSTILDPYRRSSGNMVMLGRFERMSMERFQNPLPLGQSFLVVVPHLMWLVALTLLCFGVSYLTFMRQEIRTT